MFARSERLKLSPVVRRLIAENALDPHAIQGTGRDGRITRGDVVAAVEASEGPTVAAASSDLGRAVAALPESAPSPARSTAPDVSGERIEFDRIRRLTAEHMVRSKATSPHVLQAIEVDMGNMPDMVPTLAVVAAFAEGTTVIKNVSHLKAKESDRLAAEAAGVKFVWASEFFKE